MALALRTSRHAAEVEVGPGEWGVVRRLKIVPAPTANAPRGVTTHEEHVQRAARGGAPGASSAATLLATWRQSVKAFLPRRS